MKLTTYEHEAELYANERDAVADAWRLAHKDDFRRMNDGIMGQYGANLGEWNQRSEALTRSTAQAAGFPDFATWLNLRYSRSAAA
ncbi:MAG: hypothetical protein JWL61_4962 [Gemmatimonadetes bacterium]|nr:hypothetical protein [Gemmatimonadota bacterium]